MENPEARRPVNGKKGVFVARIFSFLSRRLTGMTPAAAAAFSPASALVACWILRPRQVFYLFILFIAGGRNPNLPAPGENASARDAGGRDCKTRSN
jgi:hypothetical protein